MVNDSNGQRETDAIILARGTDSLYLYLDCPGAIDWAAIVEKAQRYDYDTGFEINGLPFIRVQAWMRTYPICLQHTQFMFFINRRTAYVKVLSLAFELRGFDGVIMWLCRILDKLKSSYPVAVPWLEFLKVSRIDVFCDFAYSGSFSHDQFRTKLRRSGFFQSGEDFEAVTFYFGNRHALLVRLYVKSAEIENSGKTYLKANWGEHGNGCSRVWRLEFEYHKLKLEEICHYRELVAYDSNTIEQLFSYGVNSFEYVTEAAKNRNLSKKPLHPIWQMFQGVFCAEYSVKKKAVKGANVEYRYKRARPWVIAWLAARELRYDEIPRRYVEDFDITLAEYSKAVLQVTVGSSSVVDYFKSDFVDVVEDES